MITKEQVLNNISSGWHSYIETIYNVLPELSFCSGVYLIEKKNGMLKVIFSRTDLTTPEQEFILLISAFPSWSYFVVPAFTIPSGAE